jgi:polysaccharide chain length determinant protein (PEP-CTERM system associated)
VFRRNPDREEARVLSGRTLPDLLLLIWRRKLWVLGPVLLGAGVAYGVFTRMDPVYRASTIILVEPQRVPSDYIKPTVTSSLDDRVRTIEQQIKNRENFTQILRKTGLYQDLMAEGEIDEAIRKVDRNLVIDVRAGSVFWIHFNDKSAEQAATVANYVTDAFIGANLQLREGQAENTTAFLSAELAEMKQQLEEQESRVADFRLRNDGLLPEQRSANEAAINRLQEQLDHLGDEMDDADLRTLILGQSALPAPTVVQKGAPVPTPSRQAELESQLAELRLRYTDRHPDVVRLQQEIDRLRSAAVEQSATASQPQVEDGAEQTTSPDPVVQAQLQAARVEMDKLREERERTIEEISLYEQRLDQTARIEVELLAMTRDYDNLQKAYNTLLSKKTEAALAENMEKGRQGEQFTILERAHPPSEPYGPNLLLYLGVGIVVGGLVGVGLVVIKEETDQRFNDADALGRAFPALPILASVPTISVLEDEASLEEAI